MTFDVLQARSVNDVPDADYPNPGAAPNSFAPEPGDGQPMLVKVSAVIAEHVSGGSHETGRAERIDGVLAVTDSRVVFSCTEFRTGGGWRGYGGLSGPLLAIAMNGASKASAVRKTRGFTLVGHVRYEWLAAILAQEKRMGASTTALKFTFVGPEATPTVHTLMVYLDKRASATDIAAEVARRAVQYKVAHTEGKLKDDLVAYASSDQRKRLPTGHGFSWMLPR